MRRRMKTAPTEHTWRWSALINRTGRWMIEDASMSVPARRLDHREVGRGRGGVGSGEVTRSDDERELGSDCCLPSGGDI